LILAIECENVALTGLGEIDGSGDFFFEEPRIYPFMSGFGWRDGFSKARDKDLLRPGQLMCFIECRHVTVQDITMKNCPCWSCFLHGCEYVSVSGVKVFNKETAANTDGIDIDCCRFVTVSDCIINTGDDAITVRCDSKRLKNKMPSEYITVTNCTCAVSASAVRIGVGTGLIRHVRVSNITIERAGTAIKYITSYAQKGEAHIEDVNFSNISAYNVGYPIQIGGSVGSIRRVTLDNMRLYGMAQSTVEASEGSMLSDITLRNIDIHLIPPTDGTIKKQIEKRGAYALSVKNVCGAVLDGVRVFRDDGEDWDGAFCHEGCEDLVLRNCQFANN
jgi:polygalacturonase